MRHAQWDCITVASENENENLNSTKLDLATDVGVGSNPTTDTMTRCGSRTALPTSQPGSPSAVANIGRHVGTRLMGIAPEARAILVVCKPVRGRGSVDGVH